jgi:5-formyltetrahydrofolate cyclo-ligase
MMDQSKAEWRKKALGWLKEQSCQEREKRSEKIWAKFFPLPEYCKSGTICFFSSLPEEVNTLPAIRRAYSDGKRVILPKAETAPEPHLDCYEVHDVPRQLKPGKFGILEPDPSKSKKIDISEIDCVLVPGLLFDKALARLGRGKGYYDKFLSALSLKTVKIGVAFSFQIVQSLPIEAHDQNMDDVLTDKD